MGVDFLFLMIVLAIVFFSLIVFLFYANRKRKQREINKLLREHDHYSKKIISKTKMDEIFIQKRDNSESVSSMALLYIDIDDFGEINDQYGKDYADSVIEILIRRLTNIIRSSDYVCHLKNDEFVVLLCSHSVFQDADIVAERILKHLSRGYNINDKICEISVSIGISFYPKNSKEFKILLEKAEKSCMNVKEYGKNNFQTASLN